MAPFIALFLSAFTSATLLPGSSEVLLLALLATGQSDALWLVAVATCGNVLGAVVNWVLGRYFAQFRDRKWFPVTPETLTRAESWYSRYGIWLLLMSWVPIIGDPLTVVAGLLRVGFWRFLLFVSLGKLGRYSAIVWGVGWWFAAK